MRSVYNTDMEFNSDYLALRQPSKCYFSRLCLGIGNFVTIRYETFSSGTGIMPSNLPGGSTVQWGAGRGLLCLSRILVTAFR